MFTALTRKTIATVAGAVACVMSSGLSAALVDSSAASAAAAGFIARSSAGSRILAGRSVASATARGSLWIVALEPSGCVVVVGSDKCAPIISFSPDDFAEPEAGSPLDVQLRGNDAWVERMEADESAGVDAGWAKYTATAAKKRLLSATAPAAETSDAYVAPFMGATWHQTAPYNDLAPYNYFCGCMATAAGQEIRYWRWPYRYEKFRTSTHGVRDALNNYYTITVRPNGLVPFDWNKVKASYTDEANASTPWAADKKATYNAAYLSFWMQSLTGMGYKPGGSGGTRQLAASAEDYWYEKGVVMTYWNDGYDKLWAAIKADLDWGSPIQINTAAHQMVVDGYAIENAGTADEIDYINLNLGYGRTAYWTDLRTAVTSGTYSGVLAAFQTGYRPQKIVQFEPLARVCSRDVTLVWHMAPCYTNRTTGFTLEISGGTSSVSSVNIATHEETTSYTVTGLEEGCDYTFTVTPVMAANEGTGRSNSVTTRIGTPQPAPEILSVSSVACGIELVQQDIFVECARGAVNQLKVTCSDSTTSLTNYSSHLTILPDEKISVTAGGTSSVSSEWIINVDATDMAQRWNVEGEMVVLTLVASNADGTETYKNLMLRFNSMRNVVGGTFDIVETSATSPVWFAGGTTTTLDAKGQAVTFASGAVNGTGTVILTDSVGNGSFTFQGLDGFTGTLKWAQSVTVNLPADMSGFAGTLNFDSYASTYRLSSSLGTSAKVYIGGTTQLYIDGSTAIDAAVTGGGYIMVVGSAPTFGNLSGFTGHISLGDFDRSGTVTIPAGQEKGVVIDNGTVNLVLSKAQVAYGYSTTAITMQGWGSVVFKDETGNVLQSWNRSQSTYSIASTANTWTPDSSTGTGNFWDAARWSQGIPGAGDYVIFNDNFGDTEMTLNLASNLNLGYVKVIGTKFNIKSTGTGKLAVDTFENTIPTKLATTNIVPTAVIPRGKLFVKTGLTMNCDIDSSLAKNLRDISDSMSALIWDDDDDHCIWRGTVVFKDYAAAYLNLNEWGHSRSFVRFNGVTGYLASGQAYNVPVELVDNGSAVALHLNNGFSSATTTFAKLFGSGTFKTSGSGGGSENILVKDASAFAGSLQLAAKNVVFGNAPPSDDLGNNGKLHILTNATLAADAIWNIGGGVYLGSGCDLTVRGQLLSTGAVSIKTCADDAAVTFDDGSLLCTAVALSGDGTPAINFKAGTWQTTQNRTETKTVNFCAPSGSRTTLDANGSTVTLGPKFFSGDGDVYLTSSRSGGRFVLQGIGADFSGTIYADISAGLVLDGDISQMRGRLSVSDIILTVASSSLGNIDAGSGASIVVPVSKGDRMRGLVIEGVNLSDGATMVLQDADGSELAAFTAGDAIDGRYILAPDENLEPSCILDYEFDGNKTSTGTDGNTLSGGGIFNADQTALYMRSQPWIANEFAMPDDEWTAVMRCTLPAANSEKPMIVIMYGVNGGNLFGIVAGTNENTVALASGTGLVGEAVVVENATTRYHVYTIVKTAGRVKLYVDGVLKINEAAGVSVAKKFQIGSVHGSNTTLYAGCSDADALVDFLRFYDFAADAAFIEAENVVVPAPKPIAVWTGDFTTAFDGCALDWHGNLVANGAITIVDGYQGVDVNLASGTNAITVIVKYSDLSCSASNDRAFFTSCAESTKTYDRTAVRLTTGNALRGSYNSSTASGTASTEYNSDGSVVPAASGYMVFSYGHPTDNNNRGTLVCTGAEEGSLNTTNYWKSGLMFAADSNGKNIYGATIGGMRRQTNSWENAVGMKIEAIAVFAERLDEVARNAYRFPGVTDVAYYKSGSFGGDDELVLARADGTSPATLTEGGTVIIDARTNNDIVFGGTLPANVGTIRVARDVTFTAGAATALDGRALIIDRGATLTIGSHVALGTATVAGAGTLAFAAFPASKPTLDAAWTGTVQLPTFRAGGETLTDYCINGTSTLKLHGITGGYLMWNDLDFQSELILDGDFILTDMSARVFRFAKISGTGNISLSPGTYELTSFTIGELAEGYVGVVSNNMRTTAINIQRLSLPAGASIAPGTKILATGGTCAINLNEVYVGGVKANVTYARRTDGADGDGFYVTSVVTADGATVTVATDGTVSSVAVPLAENFSGKIVVPASVSTLTIGGASVQSSQLVLEVAYGGTTARYENILLLGANGAVSLDPEGMVNGVAVRPELDVTAAKPYDAQGETLRVRTIPGLWYAVIYGDALVNGGVGGEATGSTTPVQATGAALELDAPRDGARAARFYKVRAEPSPAARD